MYAAGQSHACYATCDRVAKNATQINAHAQNNACDDELLRLVSAVSAAPLADTRAVGVHPPPPTHFAATNAWA